MNEFKVKKGLIVQGSGSTILDIQGSQGQLFSVTDSLSGSLFSVNDISGIPIMEVFSDNRVLLGTFNAEAIKVSGSFATITGSLFGTASFAVSSSRAVSSSNALTASFVTSSNVFGPFGSNSILSASFAVSSSRAVSSSNALTASNITPAITNAADNRVVTSNGGGTINGEQNLTFNGTILVITGSLSQGNNNVATGTFSHAEGDNTIASGSYSHAEGGSTQAIGVGSHAEGESTQAIGLYSHAEGRGTQASGSYSHAEGNSTQAIGIYSHAEGNSTVALGSYQHVQGQFNISSSAQSAFIIGNGTSDGSRSNLVFASGSQFQVTGSLIVRDILQLAVRTTTPTPIEGMIIASGSAGSSVLYYYNGTSWNALF
jgi:hypothetical protein